MWLGIAWGVLTAVLIILLIYRSTLTMQEDDQLFLDESASGMAQEQMELMAKVNKITPLVKGLGVVSGVMFLVIAGMFIYQGLNSAGQKSLSTPADSQSGSSIPAGRYFCQEKGLSFRNGRQSFFAVLHTTR
jgi:hypothetical protein